MRTSYLQYLMMVEFMEANGDLSKPTGGPRGRHFIQMKWKELTNKLNSEGTGEPRSEEKWRKVWSDYKNNCKKKCAKINKGFGGTGGGPALQLSLTDLEEKVMHIIGVQAATGMAVVKEAGFDEDNICTTPEAQPIVSGVPTGSCVIDWNTPGTSSQPGVAPPSLPTTVHSPPLRTEPHSSPPPVEAYSTPSPSPTETHPPSPPVILVDEEWKPPPNKKKKDLSKIFIDADKKAREFARQRDRVYDSLERERLHVRNEEVRVREYEIRERVRQRDVELQLQAQWLEFMKEAMQVIVRYLEKNN